MPPGCVPLQTLRRAVLARETVPPYTADQVAVDQAALFFAVMADKGRWNSILSTGFSNHGCDQRKHSTMSPMLPAFALVLAQATQPNPPSKSHEWCFERGNGAQLSHVRFLKVPGAIVRSAAAEGAGH
jgi:hypothetical protein